MLFSFFTVGGLFHEHDDELEEGVFVLSVDVEDGLFFGEVVGEGEDLDVFDVGELVSEDGWDVLVHYKGVVDHGVHFGVAEED